MYTQPRPPLRRKWMTRTEFLEYTARQDECSIEDVLKSYDVQWHPCRDPRCLGWKLRVPVQESLF